MGIRRPVASLSLACSLAIALVPSPRPLRGQTPGPPGEELATLLGEAEELLRAGQFADAVREFKKADKLAGGACADCQLGLARAFNGIGAHKEVLKSAAAVTKLTTDPVLLAGAHHERGIALLVSAGERVEKLAEAEAAFRKVIELIDANAARLQLGVALLRQARDAEGIAELEEYVRRDPRSAEAEVARQLIANPLRARKRLLPEFAVATLAGEYLTPEELRGKVVLFDFWGTWCPPCRAAIPSLRAMSQRMAKHPFVLVSVSTDSDEEVLKAFLAEQKMNWPQVWDKNREMVRRFQVTVYPSYVLVDHEGEVVYTAAGWSAALEREIQIRIGRALRAAEKEARKGS